MRVFLTGATGFLGSHLCAKLLALGHEVVAFHRAKSDVSGLRIPGVQCIQGELSDLDALRRAVAGCELAIHAAADIRSHSTDPKEQQRVNAGGPANAARACRLESVRRMVHISSTTAIGVPQNSRQPADEEFTYNLTGPEWAYALSKKMAEDAVAEEIGAGLDAIIVNPGKIFGPHGRRYRGAEFIRGVSRSRVIPYLQGGSCAVHVDDVGDGILAAVASGQRGHRYILGGDNISYREMAECSAHALTLSRLFVPIPRWPLRLLDPARASKARFHYYSSEKASRVLGYFARSFAAIIEDCLAWWPPQS